LGAILFDWPLEMRRYENKIGTTGPDDYGSPFIAGAEPVPAADISLLCRCYAAVLVGRKMSVFNSLEDFGAISAGTAEQGGHQPISSDRSHTLSVGKRHSG
jgi:hypothetical protein